jgi:ketosteroid isomerase-like protein
MTDARAVFENMRKYLLGEVAEACWAPDVVVEQPFAADGPSRIEGRDTFLARTKGSREALPVRFEEIRDVTVHETTDPNKIIVEYTMAGLVLTTGKHESATFIAVMETRDGMVTRWREYQNTFAIVRALGAPLSAWRARADA